MENTSHKPVLHQPIFRMGSILLALSFALFLMPEFLPASVITDSMGLFMIHYALGVLYFFSVLFSGRYRTGRGGLPLVVLTLLLFLISAYALNRQMDVFNESVGWVQVLIMVSSINMLLLSLDWQLPFPVKLVQVIILVISAIFYTYLAIYLVPVYAFGLLGAIAIGIGLHAFVPVLLLVYSIRMLVKEISRTPAIKWVTVSVAGAVMLLIGMYSYRWAVVKKEMETAFHNATKPDHIGWPAWVEVLQNSPVGPIGAKLLRSGIVYTIPEFDDGFDFFEAPRLRWEEARKHDPLVVIASLFSEPISIPKEDRIRMLQTLHNNRYGAEERLWSGNNLETVHMNTEVQIWPAMHLAYAEKTITVAQKPSSQTWRNNSQEAIYIFQLPEGAVVTSLSLWIEGKEEKSVLTTKGKATNAYRTIVGVEVRDPSVVHWQEGNRVSVRVFPVASNDQRIFKIGITIPMPQREGKIWYENFTFTGPSSESATEKVRVRLMENPAELIQTVALKRQQENSYTYEGKYNPDLSLALPVVPVAKHAFVHEGRSFAIQAYEPVKEAKRFTDIYADIHSGWTEDEWKQLIRASGDRTLRVYDEGWVKIDALNQQEIFERLQRRPLTLFPFFEVSHAENSLVVTKAAGRTPSLDDIRKSSGFDALVQAASAGKRFYLYHIGEQPSLYISSLRELRLFRYAQGPAKDLMDDLGRHVYNSDPENESRVVLYNAGLVIEASDEPALNNAPDHLLRLFAYNHIMQQGGLRLLADSSLEESRLGDLAAYAHIVTPISSMIVLEKMEDYGRFGIDVNKQGLQNASAQNSGSVPEPHEWALMMVCLLLLAYYKYQHKLNVLWLKK